MQSRRHNSNINDSVTTMLKQCRVLGRFPADETDKNRKLSRPWHGPYRIVAIRDPDITVSKIYFPRDKQITIHQSRVKHCTTDFLAGFYWYGGKQRVQGKIPK